MIKWPLVFINFKFIYKTVYVKVHRHTDSVMAANFINKQSKINEHNGKSCDYILKFFV